ncbi:HNH endonuclease [Candidatus Nomurabacteria bacterium]|nr:HNH endonuclease [Candidatus Nomurabacteria bacterium]
MENPFANIAYVHKLNAQELGYRGGEPGKAGRYIYISKKLSGLFFPPLSETIVNDNVLLDVIPPNSDDVVKTKFVYHNDKVAADGTRDEYRLYLNSGNDPGRDYYKPEDIVVIVKIISEDNFTYKILHYASIDREYPQLKSLLEGADTRNGTHALLEMKELTFLEDLRKIRFGKKIIPKEIIEESFNEAVEHAPVTEEDKNDTTRVIRSRSFRDLILYFYEDKCAITGKNLVIEYKDFKNLEAAHILARAAGGGSHPSNGMALERNLHWAFDKGFFTLTENYTVEVHPDAMHVSYLKDKHGMKISIPQDSRSHPNKDSIKWHNDNVFGMFLRS